MRSAASRVTLSYDLDEPPRAWELSDEPVPESRAHDLTCELLRAILAHWAEHHGEGLQVGRNLAVRWDPAHPRVGVDPDVYVAPAPPEGDAVTSLCTWQPGHLPPRVAIEVVSASHPTKDYAVAPDKYAASGTTELWVFDPLRAGPALRGGPHLVQLWRRDARGRFRRVYAGDGPVRSDAVGGWLVATDGGARLRLADDAEGARLWPTAAEAALAEVARLRAELARRDEAPKPRRPRGR